MNRRDILALASLYVLAVAVRLLPFTMTTLPYNIDAFPLIKLSENMMATGHWQIGGDGLMLYNSKMPAFSMILSSFSLMLGIEPMVLASYLVPLLTSTSVIAIYMLTMKITGSRLASYFAGLFFAISGFYLYLTTAIMKETIGLALMPIILYLFLEREDDRKRVLAAMFLVILPFIHHLTALIVFLAISILVITDNYSALKARTWSGRKAVLDVVLGPLLFVVTYTYYYRVGLEQFEKVVNFDQGILLLSVFFVSAIFAVIISQRVRAKPWFLLSASKKNSWKKIFDEKLLFVLVGIGIIVANHYMTIFAGTLRTSSQFIFLAAPYIMLVIFALIGFNVIRYTESNHRRFLVSVFAAVFIVMEFGLLRGLDPFSMDLIYRSYDFMDVGLAICLGIGLAYLTRRAGNALKRDHEVLGPRNTHGASTRALIKKTTVAAIGLVLLFATVPLAGNTESMWGIKDITREREFRAMEFAATLDRSRVIGTDQRFSDIGRPYFDLNTNASMPWSLRRGDLSGYDYVLIQDEWETAGAQMYPFGNVQLEDWRFASLLNTTDLIYSSGYQEHVYILKVR